MKTLYFLFEKIPDPQSGGLITMYRSLENMLYDTYNIKIISVFDCPIQNKKQFKSECIILNKTSIDTNFLLITKYLKKLNVKMVIYYLKNIIKYFIYIPLSKGKIKKLISQMDYTLVSCPAAAMFMSKKRKFVLEIHSKYDFFWKGSLTAKMQVKLMANPALIIFRNNTDALKGASKYPSQYVYNFFDNSSIKINNNYLCKRNKFLFVGRLSEEKNPIRLLKIIKKILDEKIDIQLDIYGQGPLENDIKQFIQSHHLDKHVYLKGYVNDKNIYAYYSALLMTSKFEGFPLTVIEAKANAIPTISTKWGEAVYETIKDGIDGYVAENDDDFICKIKLLIDDINLLKKMSENSLRDFERFNLESAKKRYIELIENVYEK